MKKIISILIIAVVIVGGYFMLNIKQGPKDTTPIKIGVASLMTGDFAVVGENIRDTATLAVEEINQNGGIDGRMVELVIEDSKCDSKTGLSAVSKLINVDKVKYIVGGMCSNGTIAAAPLANQNKVIIMTPVTGGQNVDDSGEYIFRTANSDLLAGIDLARSMIDMGYTKVGAATEITEYTLDIKKSFKAEIERLGGQVVTEEDFQPGTSDFRTTVAKMKASGVQAVLVASQTGISGAHFVAQSKQQGFNVPMFSDFTFVSNSDAKKIVGNFDGIYFADPDYDTNDASLKSFFTKFEQKYGHAPIIPFHTAATYDAIHMIVNAIEKSGDDSSKVHDWLLKNIKNYKGFMGTYSLDEKGNSDLGFVIKIIKNGEPVNIK
jgi:branched-chain amino acid transport system substrate-binding protein